MSHQRTCHSPRRLLKEAIAWRISPNWDAPTVAYCYFQSATRTWYNISSSFVALVASADFFLHFLIFQKTFVFVNGGHFPMEMFTHFFDVRD